MADGSIPPPPPNFFLNIMMITSKVTLLNETVIECLNERSETRIFKAFMDVGMKILGADYAFAWQLKNTKSKNLELVCKSDNLPFTPTARKSGRNYFVIKHHVPIFVDNIKKTPDVGYVQKYFQSYAIVPLVHKKGVHGSMVFCFKSSEQFTEEKKTMSVLLGNSAAQAITIRRLMASEQKARLMSEKQQAHFRALVENSYEIIVHIDTAGKILYVSPPIKKIMGLDPKQYVGKSLLDLAPAENNKKTHAYLQKLIANPNKRHVEEFTLKGKGGTMMYFESTSARMPENEGGGGIVINIRDITQHKKLEEAKKAQSQLREEKIKVDSIADATHELRTPLAIIKGNIDLAMQGEAKNAKSVKSILKDIDDEVRHLSGVVSDLALITSKPPGGYNVFAKQEVGIRSLVEECVGRCQSIAYKKNINLTTENIADVVVEGDRDYLEKMLTNLIKNSINYGIQNGSTRVYSSINKSSISIHVEDNGIGISKEDLEHVFERFYRGDRSHSSNVSEGTGLGLSIVKWIAEIHGGTVLVKSALNKGSTFSVKLPFSKSKP